MNDKKKVIITGDNGDEKVSNFSQNSYFGDFKVTRRDSLKLSFSAFLSTSFVMSLSEKLVAKEAQSSIPPFDFNAPAINETDFVTIPEEYQFQVFAAWGTPLNSKTSEYSVQNSSEDQSMQFGMHHDGMHFFPINGNSNDGLFVINHEYIEPRFMHKSHVGHKLDRHQVVIKNDQRPEDEVRKEMFGHGISIARIKKNTQGQWEIIDDKRNRRISALTPMKISGPAKGHSKLKTKYSPNGDQVVGTLNNCSHGVTPWNTYLFAEENWATYFCNRDTQLPREHARYGVRTENPRYAWEKCAEKKDEYLRFDASKRAGQAKEDFRNEPNNFGWIVEVDPFNEKYTPIKRTALGRFAHEGVIFQPPQIGKPIVCYSGDDARFEYIYKFVSSKPYDPDTASGSLLDEGVLYVAKFNEDQTGEWLPLVFGMNGLTPENGFSDQGDVLINTRTAADIVGATKMDRPEWGAVDPKTKDVYFTLTNNTHRTQDQVHPANPRANNKWGQIIKWTELNQDPTARFFNWNLFVLAGPANDSQEKTNRPLTSENIFCCPDGLWFDSLRRLWIQTDMGEDDMNKGEHKQFGNNQMLVANPDTGEIKRFLTGPIGQEITGVIMTPDRKNLFVNIQHPGATTTPVEFSQGKINSRWPDHNPEVYPRSATIIITRKDGREI